MERRLADGLERRRLPSAYEIGVLAGILVGEGHFGGDGRQPQVTLRMHVRHELLFRWIVERFGGKLYGPYHHGGRDYFQWMARGTHLRDVVLPLLDGALSPELDGHAWTRYLAMKQRYRL
ncbi:MAG TPA: hypothetical protein VK736_03100 [Candidatus Binatia bacterium]|nr:hypothetical protein [Candidatus Binatia bacterium]